MSPINFRLAGCGRDNLKIIGLLYVYFSMREVLSSVAIYLTRKKRINLFRPNLPFNRAPFARLPWLDSKLRRSSQVLP